jgi:hypothetical protein
MKKFMIVPVLFFNVAYGMESEMSEEMKAERALFEAFKKKCSAAITVFDKEDCYADKIDATPDEVCAAIKTLSSEARALRRETYENPLKLLVNERARAQSAGYQIMVQQLVTRALYKKGPQSAIRALLCEAIEMQRRAYDARCVELARENKRLKEESNSNMRTTAAFAAGFLAAKVSSHLFG